MRSANRRPKLWLAGILIGALTVGPGLASASGGTNVSQLTSQLNTVESEVKAENAFLGALNAQTHATVLALDQIDQQISATRQKLLVLQAEEMVATELLNRTQAEYTATVASYNQTWAALSSVLRWTEENGPIGYLAVLLQVNTFQAFTARLAEISNVSSFELKASQQLATQKQQLAHEISLINQERQSLAAAQQAATVIENQLLVQNNQRRIQLAALLSRRSSVLSLEHALLLQKNSLTAKIMALEGEYAAGKLTKAQLWTALYGIAQTYGVDPYLVMAVIMQESGGNPNAKSYAGALGLMQLMPSTAAGLSVTNPFNPIQNLQGGIRDLAGLLNEFGGNIQLALAAYNAGAGSVLRYGGIPPYAQTQNYVKSIMANYAYFLRQFPNGFQ